MGFLSGAFGKLMAGKYLRTLQFKATMVQSRLRRVTREIGQMDKMFASQKKQIDAGIMQKQQEALYPYMIAAQTSIGVNPTITDGSSSTQPVYSENWQKYSIAQQQVQAWATMAKSMWENMFEMQKESMLQPLKDLEEDLQSEKDNLESQIKIAQAEYDAKKEEEKAGAKSLAPDYTGQS